MSTTMYSNDALVISTDKTSLLYMVVENSKEKSIKAANWNNNICYCAKKDPSYLHTISGGLFSFWQYMHFVPMNFNPSMLFNRM